MFRKPEENGDMFRKPEGIGTCPPRRKQEISIMSPE
jgi:hypothetical protein